MHMPFVINVPCVDFDDRAAGDFELSGHDDHLDLTLSGSRTRLKCYTCGCV